MVLQFVGFLGAWNHPGNLPPLVSATLGALVTTWTTFVPCFLWVFLGAPYIEKLRDVKLLTAALSTVYRRGRRGNSEPRGLVWTARPFFPGTETSIGFALVVCALSFTAMLRFKVESFRSCSGADCSA